MSTAGSRYMRDPEYVRRQYESESGLASRASLYIETTGPFAGDIALAALGDVSPRRVLEVGCGTGWFAERVRDELGAAAVAVDQSERMVELARERGIDARVADAQQLPFADGEFDGAAANWMLYHVPDLDRALAEIARVLSPGGRLVAVTNGRDHLLELWQVVGAGEQRLARDLAFDAEHGEERLRRHFARVEKRDASGTVRIDDREAVVRYLRSMDAWSRFADHVPPRLEPFYARRSNVVFVAETAR